MSYTGDSSNSNISMRGFGENSQMRVLVLVDGQRYNRADMSETNWLQVPLSNVESIEILKGSQSAMYGNNAIAGVVKINTKKGAPENTLEVNGMMGSYGLYNVDAAFKGSAGDYLYNLDVNRYNNDGYRENSRFVGGHRKRGCRNGHYGFDKARTHGQLFALRNRIRKRRKLGGRPPQGGPPNAL